LEIKKKDKGGQRKTIIIPVGGSDMGYKGDFGLQEARGGKMEKT